MSRLATTALAALLAFQLAGCGTLLYPERHGQRSGRVDPAVLLFDGALLLVFLVPGLVAFGIDFHTGAIYVPRPGGRVSRIPVPPDQLTPEGIERVVGEHIGVPVRLDHPDLEVRAVAPDQDLTAAVLDASARRLAAQ